ncbi:LLM class flavin-dependent oxidoreductase [Geodermatophilus sp. URMC 62]|uniref:LLM class flavin-dependent oxidoreductase n=1 Tax=Geodermatophilus sp. URMC 62 TaxID=3423414 RepID=UPI00406BF130
MDISVGLPSHVPGARREDVLAWARRAEELGFASLVATDRFAWNQLEPLSVLALAGAVTERIRLRTSVLLLPNRGPAGPLAKQLASLQVLLGGRLELGVGVGDREVDYRLAGAEHPGRHRRLETMLEEMTAIWAGDGEYEVIGPRPPSAIPILIGGSGEKAWERVARYGAGWTFAVGRPDDFATGAEAVGAAWARHGRTGRPRLYAQRYFNLDPGRRTAAEAFLRQYFAFLGPAAEYLVAGAPLDEQEATGVAGAFRAAGAGELTLLPTSCDLDELDRLAELML